MNPPIRIAVTGSRGKSGVVRLLHAALCRCGIGAYGRITGVIPRELTPQGERPILRPGGGNVAEMAWWLRSLPKDAQAIVMENSAVMADLQGLCPRWLKPQATVLTNVRPDHLDQWGPGELNVLKALSHGLPSGGAVVLPAELAHSEAMQFLAEQKNLTLLPSHGLPNLPPHLSANMGLALEVCRYFDLPEKLCLEAMMALPPDLADFTILEIGAGRLAFAFSANDIETTEELFLSTGWRREDTGILFNHRDDRVDRFRCFEDWMGRHNWRQVLIIGHRPPRTALRQDYFDAQSAAELAGRLNGALWLGCGNTVYGLPLELKLACEEGLLP